MKKIYLVIFLSSFLNLKYGLAQTSVLGNNGLAGDYLGWDSFTTQALEIRQDNITTPYSICQLPLFSDHLKVEFLELIS